MTQSICEVCGKSEWLVPLYGDKGGPLRCFVCAGEWNAKYTRRRKWGRIIIKAIKAFEHEGGSLSDIDKLKVYAIAGDLGLRVAGYEDTIGADLGDITSELLADILQLVHPDHPWGLQSHPARRAERGTCKPVAGDRSPA
jgi:hypothetical protein